MEAQRTAITTACTQRGWLLEECFEDAGVSSVARHRPGLAAALAAVRAREADAIVVAKLDRLARSALHAATLFADAAKNNWELIIVDVDASTAGGRFMRNVMAAAAEYEHELIAARTRDALAAARARGIQLGRPRDIEPDVEDRIVSLRKRSRLLPGRSQSDSSPLTSSAPAAASDGTRPPSPACSAGTASASTAAEHATPGSSTRRTGHRDRTHQTRATESAQEARQVAAVSCGTRAHGATAVSAIDSAPTRWQRLSLHPLQGSSRARCARPFRARDLRPGGVVSDARRFHRWPGFIPPQNTRRITVRFSSLFSSSPATLRGAARPLRPRTGCMPTSPTWAASSAPATTLCACSSAPTSRATGSGSGTATCSSRIAGQAAPSGRSAHGRMHSPQPRTRYLATASAC